MNDNLIVRAPFDHSVFPNDLVIRATPRWEIYDQSGEVVRRRKTQVYRVVEEFVYLSHWFGRIVIPKGFMTDFGSVPAFTKFIVDDDDPDLLFPSLPHDLIYSFKGTLSSAQHPDGPIKLTRKQADELLYNAMLDCGAPKLKAGTVYNAVRIGGRWNWNEP